jgi:hypothetical protein
MKFCAAANRASANRKFDGCAATKAAGHRLAPLRGQNAAAAGCVSPMVKANIFYRG